MRYELDDVQKALILFFKKNTNGEWLTLREIAAEIGVKHPQTVLNKLNQLVLKWYFVKDESWYRLVRESVTDKYTDIVQLPIFGFAEEITDKKVDFPTFGSPKSPTSAKSFSSRLR